MVIFRRSAPVRAGHAPQSWNFGLRSLRGLRACERLRLHLVPVILLVRNLDRVACSYLSCSRMDLILNLSHWGGDEGEPMALPFPALHSFSARWGSH